jgi:hypothetical protein
MSGRQGGRVDGEATTRGSGTSRSNILGLVAIYIALGGSALAVQANSVGTKELKRHAVKTKQVGSAAIRGGKIARNAVRSRTSSTAGSRRRSSPTAR